MLSARELDVGTMARVVTARAIEAKNALERTHDHTDDCTMQSSSTAMTRSAANAATSAMSAAPYGWNPLEHAGD
jgi:hypothetical protein